MWKSFCVKRPLCVCVKVSVCESFFAYQLLCVKVPLCVKAFVSKSFSVKASECTSFSA